MTLFIVFYLISYVALYVLMKKITIMLLSYLYIIVFVLPIGIAHNVYYKAAVVEFATNNASDVQQRFAESLNEYFTFITQAANESVDIIVFPEGGLTGLQLTLKETAEVSVNIPDVNNSSLCLYLNRTYNRFLTNLSCTVRQHSIYVVINLIEKDDEEEKTIYYSTNIVFDREGVIIAKYRKINLYSNEQFFTAGKEVTTFITDFGVHFGIFISNDIMFKIPSINILQNNSVTNIIYSTAWFSTLSFFTANTVQQGYSKSNAVNLVAAGLSDPDNQNGGSGIYLHTGAISNQYISYKKSSKMLVSDIPIFKSRTNLLNTCQISSMGTYVKNVNIFNIFTVNSSSYNYKAITLNLKNGAVTDTICDTGHDFCCTFNIIFNVTSSPNYVYKLLVFKDTLLTPTEGCGLVTCLNENFESCCKRSLSPLTGVTFLNISIQTISLIQDEDRPVMLLRDLTASNNYNYCKQKIGKTVKISLSTAQEESDFLVFGVFILTFNLNSTVTNKLINWYLFSTCTLIVLTVIYKRSNIIRSLR